MNWFIVSYHDELDGDRIVVFAVQARDQEEALTLTNKEAEDWNLSQETTVRTTLLVSTTHTPILAYSYFR